MISKAGTVIDGLDIHGFVDVKAPNVTIRNSVVRGGVATYDRGLVTNTTPAATNLVIEDSTLVPAHPSVYLDGLKGSNFTGRRLDISGGVDAVKVHGSNVRVEASWLHGMARYAADPNQRGGPTHNDGVQVLGGNDIVIVGNTIQASGNAGMQVAQDYARTTGLVFSPELRRRRRLRGQAAPQGRLELGRCRWTATGSAATRSTPDARSCAPRSPRSTAPGTSSTTTGRPSW